MYIYSPRHRPKGVIDGFLFFGRHCLSPPLSPQGPSAPVPGPLGHAGGNPWIPSRVPGAPGSPQGGPQGPSRDAPWTSRDPPRAPKDPLVSPQDAPGPSRSCRRATQGSPSVIQDRP